MTPPRYYDKMLEQIDITTLMDKEYDRQIKGMNKIEDNTPQRLLAKEICAIAKRNMKRKKLI